MNRASRRSLVLQRVRDNVLQCTRSLVKSNCIKRAFFDSPRTIYETLSVYPYSGRGLVVTPSEWLCGSNCYVITNSTIDKGTNLHGNVEGIFVEDRTTLSMLSHKQFINPKEIPQSINNVLALKPWRVLGRVYNPSLKYRSNSTLE
jgi:hypothetical protein